MRFLMLIVATLFAMSAQAGEWNTRAEAALSIASGNTDTKSLSGCVDTSVEEGRNRYVGKTSVAFAKSGAEETSNRFDVETRYERAITDRLFGFCSGEYLMDRFAGYDYRVAVGPGLGVNLIDNELHDLSARGSAQITRENYVANDQDSKNFASGCADLEYAWHVTETLTLREAAGYSVSFEDVGRYGVTSTTRCELRVTSGISVGMRFDVSYQNNPPDDAIRKTDRTLLSSIIVDL